MLRIYFTLEVEGRSFLLSFDVTQESALVKKKFPKTFMVSIFKINELIVLMTQFDFFFILFHESHIFFCYSTSFI